MRKRVWIIFSLLAFGSNVMLPQSISGGAGNQSCGGGGEMWVCGSAQQSQAHSDYDANCGDYEFANCTLIRTVVDVCSPDILESRIIQGDPESCEVLIEVN